MLIMVIYSRYGIYFQRKFMHEVLSFDLDTLLDARHPGIITFIMKFINEGLFCLLLVCAFFMYIMLYIS